MLTSRPQRHTMKKWSMELGKNLKAIQRLMVELITTSTGGITTLGLGIGSICILIIIGESAECSHHLVGQSLHLECQIGSGRLLMLLAIVALFLLPWLDRCKVKSIRYRGWTFKLALVTFVVSFIALGYLGLQPATEAYVILARIFTALYFGFFLFMPIYTSMEKTKPVPERVVWKK